MSKHRWECNRCINVHFNNEAWFRSHMWLVHGVPEEDLDIHKADMVGQTHACGRGWGVAIHDDEWVRNGLVIASRHTETEE